MKKAIKQLTFFLFVVGSLFGIVYAFTFQRDITIRVLSIVIPIIIYGIKEFLNGFGAKSSEKTTNFITNKAKSKISNRKENKKNKYISKYDTKKNIKEVRRELKSINKQIKNKQLELRQCEFNLRAFIKEEIEILKNERIMIKEELYNSKKEK